MSIEAMKAALEVLEGIGLKTEKMQNAIDLLRLALAEPVMYIDSKRLTQGTPDLKPGMVFQKPKREWVGLTEDEVTDCFLDSSEKGILIEEAIEARLKEKNA